MVVSTHKSSGTVCSISCDSSTAVPCVWLCSFSMLISYAANTNYTKQHKYNTVARKTTQKTQLNIFKTATAYGQYDTNYANCELFVFWQFKSDGSPRFAPVELLPPLNCDAGNPNRLDGAQCCQFEPVVGKHRIS